MPRRCIADPELKLYQYTAIYEYSRYRVLGAYGVVSIPALQFTTKIGQTPFQNGLVIVVQNLRPSST